MKKSILLAVMFAAKIAAADQCSVLTQAHLDTAMSLAKLTPKVLQFCQPCGDETPLVVDVAEVGSEEWKPDPAIPGLEEYSQMLTINKVPWDLAYAYVKVGDTTWANLGLLANCHFFKFDWNHNYELKSVHGVSQFITEQDGKFTPSPIF